MPHPVYYRRVMHGNTNIKLCVSIHSSKIIPSILCPIIFIFLFLHLSVNLSASASTILQLQTIKLSKHIYMCVCVCVCVLGEFKDALASRAVRFCPRNKTTVQIMGVSFNWSHTNDIKFTKGQKRNTNVFARTEDLLHAVIWYSATFQ